MPVSAEASLRALRWASDRRLAVDLPGSSPPGAASGCRSRSREGRRRLDPRRVPSFHLGGTIATVVASPVGRSCVEREDDAASETATQLGLGTRALAIKSDPSSTVGRYALVHTFTGQRCPIGRKRFYRIAPESEAPAIPSPLAGEGARRADEGSGNLAVSTCRCRRTQRIEQPLIKRFAPRSPARGEGRPRSARIAAEAVSPASRRDRCARRQSCRARASACRFRASPAISWRPRRWES